MKLLLNLILLPLLPLRLAWKWSEGTTLKSSGIFTKRDRFGREVADKYNGCLPRLIGTVIIAGILYGLIGYGIRSLIEMFQK